MIENTSISMICDLTDVCLLRVREACTLLTLKTGSAILLKETLYSALHEPSRDASLQQTDPKAALRDIGVFTLTPEQAESVLSLRTHLSVT